MSKRNRQPWRPPAAATVQPQAQVPRETEWVGQMQPYPAEPEMPPTPQPPRNGQPPGVPLFLRAAAARVPLAQALAALSTIDKELLGQLAQVDLSDHPQAAKLFAALARSRQSFAAWYHDIGVALGCVAPGEEGQPS
jgi:hypothetical protein